MKQVFEVGDRVLYDPRWKTGRRLYATVVESSVRGGYYAIDAKISSEVSGARIVGVQRGQLRLMSAVELLAEVVQA